MKLSAHKSNIRAVRQGDLEFVITDGIMKSPRAGFEIVPECPGAYRMVIRECIERGWLKPVAHIKEQEYLGKAMQLIFDEFNGYWVWVNDKDHDEELSPQFDEERDAILWQQRMKRIFTGK